MYLDAYAFRNLKLKTSLFRKTKMFIFLSILKSTTHTYKRFLKVLRNYSEKYVLIFLERNVRKRKKRLETPFK